MVPGRLSPALAALAVQFGAECPFGRAAELLTVACGTRISPDTVRRLTARAGAAWWQLELDLVTRLEAAALDPHAPPVRLPDAPPVSSDRTLVVELDGAMVPLVGGAWAEVRTLVVGVHDEATTEATTDLSYVSQLASATTFGRTVLGELTRRGVTEHPGAVVAISDGAVWIQEVFDLHCPKAVRVLDVMHAAGYLAQAAQATFGPGTAATSEWFATWRHALRQGEITQVLAALGALSPSSERDTAIHYLATRRTMLDYPRCDAAGWPVGSGAVESANKLVVETRLKGPGMHWTRRHANAMVGLRAMIASGRWATTWPRMVRTMQTERQVRAIARRSERRLATAPDPVPAAVPARPAAPAVPPARPPLMVDGKPTADHPWRRFRSGQADRSSGSS